MSLANQSRARDEFTATLAKLLRLDDESASLLAEAVEEFIAGTVMDKHDSEYYHNRRPD